MTRLAKLPLEQWDAELREMAQADSSSGVERDSASVWAHMAMRYQSAIDDGLTEGLVCSLEKPLEAPDLTNAEKAALAYADISSTNHFAIDDRTFDELRRFYSEAEIVELGTFIGFFIGFGRLAASWDMVEHLPGAFQDKSSKVTPWQQQESLVVRG